MGNCLSGGSQLDTRAEDKRGKKGSQESAQLKQLHYLDSQRRPRTANGTITALPINPATPGVSDGYPVGVPAYSAYQLEAPFQYPTDHLGQYYQPVGTLMFMDPNTGTTFGYGYEQDAYKLYTDNERLYERRQERRRSSLLKPGDDDNNNDAASRKEGGEKKHHRRQNSGSMSQGAPWDTSDVISVASSTLRKRRRPEGYQPADVVLSFCKTDAVLMKRIKEKLEASGMTVFVKASSTDKERDVKVGEAIIDAKAMVVILTEKAAASRRRQDEIALAYVSNTALFPVHLDQQDKLLAKMDPGLKLLMTPYKWLPLTSPASASNDLDTGALIAAMQAGLEDLTSLPADGAPLPPPPPAFTSEAADGGETMTSPDDVAVGVDGGPDEPPISDLPPPPCRVDLRTLNRVNSPGSDASLTPERFWFDKFGASDFISWDSRFAQKVCGRLLQHCELLSSDDHQYLVDCLKRRLVADDKDVIFKHRFIAYCIPDGQSVEVWQRLHMQVLEAYSVRRVFSRQSSIRTCALNNFDQFRCESLVQALRELSCHVEPNVRAMATVSMARADLRDQVTLRHILRMLSDSDRLVREAGCIALGHMKVREAISKLIDLWRNDPVPHVRASALAAIQQIGGDEAEDALQATRDVAREIHSLADTKL